MQRAVDQVDPADPLEWARTKMIGMQAKSTVGTAIAATAEDLMARIKSWLD